MAPQNPGDHDEHIQTISTGILVSIRRVEKLISPLLIEKIQFRVEAPRRPAETGFPLCSNKPRGMRSLSRSNSPVIPILYRHFMGELSSMLQKSRMLLIQGVRGCSCSVLPQTLGNKGYAGYSAFPQGKKQANFIKILEFARGRFQIFKSNFSEAIRLLSFVPL